MPILYDLPAGTLASGRPSGLWARQAACGVRGLGGSRSRRFWVFLPYPRWGPPASLLMGVELSFRSPPDLAEGQGEGAVLGPRAGSSGKECPDEQPCGTAGLRDGSSTAGWTGACLPRTG